jgi:hypothetical protein
VSCWYRHCGAVLKGVLAAPQGRDDVEALNTAAETADAERAAAVASLPGSLNWSLKAPCQPVGIS